MGKPLIVGVASDAGLAGRLDRDLSDRYAAHYQVALARSGDVGLNILRDRDPGAAPVALVVCDFDLEGCTGIEFMDKVQSLCPGAKRVVVIGWGTATWQATSSAIALGRIDDFVQRPWTSPEHSLYRVTGDLLADWADVNIPGYEIIKVVAEPSSQKSYEARDLLDHTPIPYGFYWADSAPGLRLLEENNLLHSPLPVYIFEDGRTLVAPSYGTFAEAVGARSTPIRDEYDVAIIGCGPAGLAAAVYGASEGLGTVLVEQLSIGGQAGSSSMIRNYMGFARGVSGKTLTLRAWQQASSFGAETVFGNPAVSLRSEGVLRVLSLNDGSEVRAHAVVIAIGVAWRRLDVLGIEDLLGRGVFYGAGAAEAPSMSGRNVFVVGGGNSAGQAAIHLARYAAQVTMIVRGKALGASLSDYLVKQIEMTPNIKVRLNTHVVGALGTGRLEHVELNTATAGTEALPADGLFILIGAEPRTKWLSPTIACDESGYILTGRDVMQTLQARELWPLERFPYLLETSVPGVFAAGDVRYRSIKRVASASGEGATTIQLTHEYLSGV